MRPIRCRKHLTQNDLHKKHKEMVPFKKKLDSRYRRGHAPPVGVTSRGGELTQFVPAVALWPNRIGIVMNSIV
jgi:hypothetical protein